jgi:ABC-2 type transport system permease protein
MTTLIDHHTSGHASGHASCRDRAAGAAPRRTPDLRAPGFLADTWNVMVRELKPVFREPASVLFAMVQPLVFLGLFAPLLPSVENGSALQWFVPGIIAMTALMGASFTGANLTQEIVTGSHERLLVSPLSRSSLLVGRALKEIVPMLMQAAIIVAVVTPFGFDLHLAHVLVGVVILAGFSIGIGALSFALALVSKDQEWLFWTVQQTLIFPLLLLAGVLLPLDGAPGWLRAASHVNPLTYVVGTERALFAGTFPVDTVLYGVVASGLVAVFGLAVGLRAMRASS